MQAAVAVFNVLINLWLIPVYSWRGAAWSSIASDGVLLISVATAVWILSRRAVQAPAIYTSFARTGILRCSTAQ